MSQVKQF